ncbi:MAG TPA: hypothetical protein VMN36_05680 [Verrucomicrobiales bacterium]|nr:hypothetical protein [Verrucomicrobiales bacterium]
MKRMQNKMWKSALTGAAMLAASFGEAQEDAPVAEPAPAGLAEPAPPARVQGDLMVETGDIVVLRAAGFHREIPVFFTARAESKLSVGTGGIRGEMRVHLRILQGKAERLVLGLEGPGEVVSVEMEGGEPMRDWAIRQATGEGGGRLLEIRPAHPGGEEEYRILLRTAQEVPALPAEVEVLTVGMGEAAGFVSQVEIVAEEAVEVRAIGADGWEPLGAGQDVETLRFQTAGAGTLRLRVAPFGAAPAAVELREATLEGTEDAAAGSVAFVLSGVAQVRDAEGGVIDILRGHAALRELPEGLPYRVELGHDERGSVYRLRFESAGAYPVRLEFDAAVEEDGEWSRLRFAVPAGAVVPVFLRGFSEEAHFQAGTGVFPRRQDDAWRGFLPADGQCLVAWKKARDAAEGELFYASDSLSEAQVGAGLMRQSFRLGIHVLQGGLDRLQLLLDGSGEVLSVEGANVLGWTVTETGGGMRRLEIPFSRPIRGDEQLVVRSQTALGGFPVRVAPLRLTPEGAVRHSGHVRVSNSGAVKVEVTGVEGLAQLGPAQYPAEPLDGAGSGQVFVYRFPSAGHTFEILADRIVPEVSVSQVLVYEMGETDRVLYGKVELDIREAPLGEWDMQIPGDYVVVGVGGAAVSDYVAGPEAAGEPRSLKVLFGGSVSGRQLVQFRLERNVPATAGPWALPPVRHPAAKSVRGHLGVVASPGFRVSPARVEELSELPLSYFPEQVNGLQQAFRIRSADWNAEMGVEAMGQSVQADVFHRYALKEGIAYGSVLLNYFVVGAPVSEWRLQAPETVGNVTMEGQNVQGWRREGNELVVTLHRPALGASTLLVTFEQPMQAQGGILRPGEVQPVGVQGERGFIQLASPSQVRERETTVSPGLLRIEASELPAEFRLLTSWPTVAAYQYTARPFDLELGIEWFEPAGAIDQLVDFATLSTQVSRDGEAVTEARFFVKTRGQKALRMRLPEGGRLWEARVAGEAVNARQDEGAMLIPLSAEGDPNRPVEVMVRVGRPKDGRRTIEIVSPAVDAPVLITEWKVEADRGRLLVPVESGVAQVRRFSLTESGWDWLRLRGSVVLVVALILSFFLVSALLRSGRPGGGLRLIALVLAPVLALWLAILAIAAGETRRVNDSAVEFTAPVAAPGESVVVAVKNLPAWQAMISWPGLVLAAAGLAALVWFRRVPERQRMRLAVLAAVLLGAGLLCQRGGAVLFFAALALALTVFFVIPGWRSWLRDARDWRKRQRAARAAREEGSATGPEPEGPGTPAPAVSLFLAAALSALALSGGAERAWGQESPASTPAAAAGKNLEAADRIDQQWRIEEERLYGEAVLRVEGKENDSLLLLRAPAVLTRFEGEGTRVTKLESGGEFQYRAVLERDGLVEVRAWFELPVGDLAVGVSLPGGRAAVQTLEIRYDERGWEFRSPMAVRVEAVEGLPEGWSGARLLLGPEGEERIEFHPLSRDMEAEVSQFYVETANAYLAAPGLVDGRHRVEVRPSQGQMRELTALVPEGFTVSRVGDGPVEEWRFDPESRALRISLTPPQSTPFSLTVETQRGTGPLPVSVNLGVLGIEGAESEGGLVALVFGTDAKPQEVTVEGMPEVGLEDFDRSLLWAAAEEGAEAPSLRRVFRYGDGAGNVALTVGPVDPEVRVATQQTLSLGEERVVLAVDLRVSITRAGLFKLSFPLPGGLEVEAVSGPAFSHWTELEEDGVRVVTLHLTGRTLGEQSFALTLAGTPPVEADWDVPRVVLRESTRQTGRLLVAPQQGIRVQPLTRSNVSQLDVREVAEDQPGTLAFRLLQRDWALQLRVERLDPWITANALQETTLREGVTRTRLSVRYQVENAPVKAARLRLAGLSEEEETTVRASGDAVSDIVRVSGEAGLWEVRFQRGMIGEFAVVVDHQRVTERESGEEAVTAADLIGARQTSYWLALRGSGRLELSAADPPGWQAADWGSVPAALKDPADRSVPALAFRAVEAGQPLIVGVKRHGVVEALKLRVAGGQLRTVFSPAGEAVTVVNLQVEVLEKSSLRARLPEGSQLFNVFVNGESVAVVREGDEYLFYVLPREDAPAAEVTLTYSSQVLKGRRIVLQGPHWNVPLQNVEWRVVMPQGYRLADSKGSLELHREEWRAPFGLEDYLKSYSMQREREAQGATLLLEQANTWLQQGEQEKARQALSRASKAQALDAASNEDARVQLRELQTQQAVMGLNTRRQRLYLDNRMEDPGALANESLEQAAGRNPLLQGEVNYDPQQVDALLQGNTAEEVSVLKKIAARLVSQQLAAEPVLRMIAVTLPERGEVLTFSRSVQVDGEVPVDLRLKIAKVRRVEWWFVVLVCAALGGAVAVRMRGWPRLRDLWIRLRGSFRARAAATAPEVRE